jgi:hypothetical protein
MEMKMNSCWAPEDSWLAILASLLPLFMLSMAVMVEGFPDPPISPALAVTAFVLAIVTGIDQLRRGWLEIDLLLYSLIPFTLLVMFDEISTSYKTPFILVCALILSAGIIGAQRSKSVTLRCLTLLFFVVLTWALATRAVQNYWHMVDNLVFGECFPYAQGCPPLSGDETKWWVLFLSP